MATHTGIPVTFQPRNASLQLLPVRDAFPVSFPGFDELEFRLYKMDGVWAIAELTTGMPIVRGMDSKAHAKDKALVVLSMHGVEKTRKVVADTMVRIMAAVEA